MNRWYLAAPAALAAAGLAAAGCGSPAAPSAGTASPAGSPSTGTQVMTGSLSGRAVLQASPRVPVRISGPVDTTATVALGSGLRNPVTFRTPQGNLALNRSPGKASQRLLSPQTCRFALGQRSSYTVVPGKSTGAFRGATGKGSAVITITGNLPKKNGKCDTSTSARPDPAGLRVSFTAHGPLTVRK